VTGFLERIRPLAQSRAAAARTNEGRFMAVLRERPAPPDFLDALRRPPFAVIAEAKERSPSRGRLETGVYDPVARARGYQAAGADALSVLTEPEFFGGSLAHLAAVAEAVALPVLRKDFLLDPAQVAEARAYGAAAVLLIVRLLAPGALREMLDAAQRLAVAALVEVHTAGELETALEAGAVLVGVNNRDLDTFTTDVGRCLALASSIPPDRLGVAESGLRTPEDLAAVRAAGYRAALIGESFMTGGAGLWKAVRAWRSS
jgi:indole-3-glycerol phosphate synthase